MLTSLLICWNCFKNRQICWNFKGLTFLVYGYLCRCVATATGEVFWIFKWAVFAAVEMFLMNIIFWYFCYLWPISEYTISCHHFIKKGDLKIKSNYKFMLSMLMIVPLLIYQDGSVYIICHLLHLRLLFCERKHYSRFFFFKSVWMTVLHFMQTIKSQAMMSRMWCGNHIKLKPSWSETCFVICVGSTSRSVDKHFHVANAVTATWLRSIHISRVIWRKERIKRYTN